MLPQQGVGWVVSLEFDSEGAKALADASTALTALPECGTAGANPCNAFAIVLDGVVVSAPRFNEPILGGSAQIEGNFTAQEARDLANVLKYGALPVTLTVVDLTSVSPTVGQDQLQRGPARRRSSASSSSPCTCSPTTAPSAWSPCSRSSLAGVDPVHGVHRAQQDASG